MRAGGCSKLGRRVGAGGRIGGREGLGDGEELLEAGGRAHERVPLRLEEAGAGTERDEVCRRRGWGLRSG